LKYSNHFGALPVTATGSITKRKKVAEIRNFQGNGLSKRITIRDASAESTTNTHDKILKGSFTLCSTRINLKALLSIIYIQR